jgi:hypothetical protein
MTGELVSITVGGRSAGLVPHRSGCATPRD